MPTELATLIPEADQNPVGDPKHGDFWLDLQLRTEQSLPDLELVGTD